MKRRRALVGIGFLMLTGLILIGTMGCPLATLMSEIEAPVVHPTSDLAPTSTPKLLPRMDTSSSFAPPQRSPVVIDSEKSGTSSEQTLWKTYSHPELPWLIKHPADWVLNPFGLNVSEYELGFSYDEIASPSGRRRVTVTQSSGLLNERLEVTDSHSAADLTLRILATPVGNDISVVEWVKSGDISIGGHRGYLVEYVHSNDFEIHHILHLFVAVAPDLYEVEVEAPASQWSTFQTQAREIVGSFELLVGPSTSQQSDCKTMEQLTVSDVVGEFQEFGSVVGSIEVSGMVTNHCSGAIDVSVIAGAFGEHGEVLATSDIFHTTLDLDGRQYIVPHPIPILHLAAGQSETIILYLPHSGDAIGRAVGVNISIAGVEQ